MIGLVCTALLPSFLKRIIYRFVFGYRIGRHVRFGLVYLDCAALTIGDETSIGHFTAFVRCGSVSLGHHVQIGFLNLFRGGSRVELGDYAQVLRLNLINAIPDHDCSDQPDSSFHLGYGSVITAEHRIDFTDRVRIGCHSILAGRNSSLWTHNRRTGCGIVIGDYCYLGSEIRMAPGASVPDCCIVGMGSVVTGPLVGSYALIAGVPAKRQRMLCREDYELIFGKTRSDLPDQVYPVLPLEVAAKR